MKVMGTGSWCMLEEYVKKNYYARFSYGYHSCSEMCFSSRFDKVSGVWQWGHGACLKSI